MVKQENRYSILSFVLRSLCLNNVPVNLEGPNVRLDVKICVEKRRPIMGRRSNEETVYIWVLRCSGVVIIKLKRLNMEIKLDHRFFYRTQPTSFLAVLQQRLICVMQLQFLNQATAWVKNIFGKLVLALYLF